MSFEKFQDGPSWILERNDLSNFVSLSHCDASHYVSAQSDLGVWEISFEEFQDGHHGSHLGYQNGMILPILNLCVTVMPPIKSFDSIRLTVREMSFEEFQDGRHGSHLGYRNDFSNSESLCHCDASHQVSAQSDLRFGRRCQFGRRCCLKNFKMAGHLGYRNGTILAILNLHVATMPSIKFHLNPTYHSGGDDKNMKG